MRIRRHFHWSHIIAVASLVVAAFTAVVHANNVASVNGSVENFDEIVDKQLAAEYAAGSDRHLLSRKRRYLIFPEGSSFQVVWDGIVGVVDYTNYLILGITLALAWELPSKTPSELAEDLQTRLQDGTLGTLRRNDNSTTIKYADGKEKQTKPSYQGGKPPGFTPNYIKLSTPQRYQLQPMFHSPMHQKYNAKPLKDAYYRRGPPPTGPWRRKDNYYYKATPSSPFTKWTHPRPGVSNNIGQYPWWNLASRISNSWRRPQASAPNQSRIDYRQNKPEPAAPTRRPGATARHHRIYPIFGKRSVPEQRPPSGRDTSAEARGLRQKRHGIPHRDELSKLERIHIRHHRRTRHVLYGKIESYMDKFGHNGHHCVLRALCETGQKSGEPEPGSFVGELMRVVFTMPEPEEDAARLLHREQRYDAANAYREDCAARYHHCKHSMWESPFVM